MADFQTELSKSKVWSDYKKGRLVYVKNKTYMTAKVPTTKFVGTSLTVVSGLALLLVFAFSFFGVEVSDSESLKFVEGVIAVVSFVGVVIGRFRAKKSVTLLP